MLAAALSMSKQTAASKFLDTMAAGADSAGEESEFDGSYDGSFIDDEEEDDMSGDDA
jgi:hypothetical protein